MDTQGKLIETAERLFAERGINGVSLREIGAEAGQRNTGAARYHFGSKDGLVDAVFRYRMEPINQRRVAMLAAVGDDDLRGLLEAFVYPLSEQLGEPGRPSWYLRFLVQATVIRPESYRQHGQPWTSGAVELQRRLERSLRRAGVPAGAVADRVYLLLGYIVHALADREHACDIAPRTARSPRAEFLAHLVGTAVALATAPSTTIGQHRRPA